MKRLQLLIRRGAPDGTPWLWFFLGKWSMQLGLTLWEGWPLTKPESPQLELELEPGHPVTPRGRSPV